MSDKFVPYIKNKKKLAKRQIRQAKCQRCHKKGLMYQLGVCRKCAKPKMIVHPGWPGIKEYMKSL